MTHFIHRRRSPAPKRRRVGIFVVLCIFFLAGSAASFGAEPEDVLVLHSYHPGYPWTGRIEAGLRSVFDAADIDVAVEYMDTKRFHSQAYYDALYRLYELKYRNRQPKLLLTTDDNALNFVLAHRQALFPDPPIVFCGLNNYSKALVSGHDRLTGVVEDFDLKSTIDIALKLHTDAERLVFINDATPSGRLIGERLERILPLYENRIEISFLQNLTIQDMIASLEALAPSDVVVYLTYQRDKTGKPVSVAESLAMLRAHCRAPVYNSWDHMLGLGVVGGRMVSGWAQGAEAAKMALRILKGEPADAVPVVTESPNQWMFDDRQLQRFPISEAALPEGRIVQFRPDTFYSRNRTAILWAGVAFLVLIGFIIALLMNIRTRRRVEMSLRESEERLDLAMTFANDGLFDWNLKTNEIYYSPGWKRLLGYKDHEIRNEFSAWETLTHPDDVRTSWQMLREVLEGKRDRFEMEFRMRHKDGHWVDILARANALFDDSAKGVRVVGTHVDITERKRAERDLWESKQRFQKIFHSQPDAIFLLNAEHPARILEANEAAAAVFGYPLAEIIGQTTDILHADADRLKTFQEALRSAIQRGGHLNHFEFTMKRKDGKTFPSEHTVLELKNDAGERTGWLSIVRDLTERKAMEIRLQQSQKMEAIGTLAGGIAHDFNNILFPLLGYAEMLQDDLPEDSPLRQSVDEIIQATLRARDLVRQILTFSRQGEQEMKPLLLQPILKEAVKLLRATIPTSIPIRQDIDPDCGVVIADPTQIHQIIMNLATNAFHAMEHGDGELTLTLRTVRLEAEDRGVFKRLSPGDYALFSVADTGAGIDPSVLDKVFDPYFTTKDKTRGTGLGLSVVQGIVKNCGGDVFIYSEPGEGTDVRVYLPIVESTDRSAPREAAGPVIGGNDRILLVDDEAAIVRMIQEMLQRMGYSVTSYASSMDALAAFTRSPDAFDLVVTDMAMPHMTGIRLSQEIKKIRPGTPVIICTGFSDQIDEEKCQALGVQGCLMKPIIRRELAALIRKVLEEAEN